MESNCSRNASYLIKSGCSTIKNRDNVFEISRRIRIGFASVEIRIEFARQEVFRFENPNRSLRWQYCGARIPDAIRIPAIGETKYFSSNWHDVYFDGRAQPAAYGRTRGDVVGKPGFSELLFDLRHLQPCRHLD